MARVKIRADGGMVNLLPGGRREIEVETSEGETVGSLLDRIGIKHSSVQLITVNRAASGPDKPVADGDVISLMPMIVGG